MEGSRKRSNSEQPRDIDIFETVSLRHQGEEEPSATLGLLAFNQGRPVQKIDMYQTLNPMDPFHQYLQAQHVAMDTFDLFSHVSTT